MNKKALLQTIIYFILAVSFCGLLFHDAGQTIYWVIKYKLDLDWLTWFYFGINMVCRTIVIGLFTVLVIKTRKKISYPKCRGRIPA